MKIIILRLKIQSFRKCVSRLRCQGKWTCEKSLSSSQLDAFLEGKVERANLTSDAHKWQAVIKSGEHGMFDVAARNVYLIRARI